jgi:hypothetical protein
MPSRAAAAAATNTTANKKGDMTSVNIEAAFMASDPHIERLQAKLSFLIRSYDPRTELLYQHEKKIATVKHEIEYAMEQRRKK